VKEERVPFKGSNVEVKQQEISKKTKNKMGGNGPEEGITDPRNTTMEETSWGIRKNGGAA